MASRGFAFLLLLWPLAAFAADTDYTVTKVINGKSFIASTGDTVRLASIEVPNAQEEDTPALHGRPGEPLGEEAKQALTRLIAGKRISIHSDPGERDRHHRLIGQIYEDSTWLQGEMLREGFAMAYSFSDTSSEITQKMLVEERTARDAKRGIWSHPYYRVITPAEADEFINRFKLVEGKVVSVHRYHDNIYINFFEQWRGRFAVFISHKHRADFGDLENLTGKTIRLRGWIHYYNAPMISLTHKDEIELVTEKD